MSSTYRILCLSHDPAIVLDQEYSSGSGGRENAEAAVLAGIDSHPGCDLLIGRYGYPLLEIGCPDRSTGHRGGYHPHSTRWVDAEWIKLLAFAQRAPEGSPEREFAGRPPMPGCWWPERLHRLRIELGLPEPAPVAPAWPPPQGFAIVHTHPESGAETVFKISETHLISTRE